MPVGIADLELLNILEFALRVVQRDCCTINSSSNLSVLDREKLCSRHGYATRRHLKSPATCKRPKNVGIFKNVIARFPKKRKRHISTSSSPSSTHVGVSAPLILAENHRQLLQFFEARQSATKQMWSSNGPSEWRRRLTANVLDDQFKKQPKTSTWKITEQALDYTAMYDEFRYKDTRSGVSG